MSRRRHCEGGEVAESLYRELTTAHLLDEQCPDDAPCADCFGLVLLIDAEAEECRAKGCTVARCRFDPPRLHHSNPPKHVLKRSRR
jgi:hypothetical protein